MLKKYQLLSLNDCIRVAPNQLDNFSECFNPKKESPLFVENYRTINLNFETQMQANALTQCAWHFHSYLVKFPSVNTKMISFSDKRLLNLPKILLRQFNKPQFSNLFAYIKYLT
jgi:hypothetical protein